MGAEGKEKKSKKSRREEEGGADAAVDFWEDQEAIAATAAQKNDKKEKKSKKSKDIDASAEAVAVEDAPQDAEKPKKRKRSAENDEHATEANNNATSASSEERKPLPEGYICNACKQPGHAIYECPLKIKKIHVEPKRIIFLSKIPKTWEEADVMKFFTDNGVAQDKLSNLKLVADAKSNYLFKGIVLITATGNDAISKVLALNGHELEGKPIVVKFNESLKKQKREPPAGVKTCYRCGQVHSQEPNQCPNPRICYKCKGTDHLSSNCPKKMMKSKY